MENTNRFNSLTLFFFSLVITFSLISSALCLVAEFKKSKKEDILFDAKLCSLPQTDAFTLGLASLICVVIAQIIGTSLCCRTSCPGEDGSGSGCKPAKPTVSCTLLAVSWISFGIAVILISTATSMSRHQTYGEGWLNGECYLVRDGIYICAAVLALLASGSALGSASIRMRQSQGGDDTKFIHKIDG